MALFGTTVPASAIIIWLSVISIKATSAEPLFPSFVLGICILSIIYAVGWLLIPELRRAAQLEELLSDFFEISDKFTRPKLYVHRSFAAPKEPKEPKDFAYLVGAKSDGTLMLPRMAAGSASIMDEQYGVCINLGDELFGMHNVGYWDDRTLLERACHHLDKNLESVHIRITPHNKKSNVIHGDFTIEGHDAKAFLETLKLVYLFKRNRNRPNQIIRPIVGAPLPPPPSVGVPPPPPPLNR